ncbi:glutamyl-tRNA reductase [Streptococcus ovuberis]|uniref:Glutamyl-tRNA reductase n=1 Tax=Streptococcus ovuberis TaxID=1936207 RepID=A0A7X6MXW8_9STRE|nr:glutamyl-tRNA reductase [Streptococcus ovuberis]NKZ20412.1 glutamyl-tRNA reductase [Streptococcus ovuberis]
MYLLYVGLTHKQTPFSLLEKVHFSDQEQEEALLRLKREKSVLEDVIISTCNRTELYLVVDQLHTGRYYAKHFLANWFQLPVEELEPYLVMKEADTVLEHLLRVSVGLESKILGETQILGQVKRAFQRAKEVGTTGMMLNEVARRVITFAKRMHEVYRINARPISIGLTAMQTLEDSGFDVADKQIAIVGLGEIGQLVTKYALQKDFGSIVLVNRTLAKAEPFLTDQRVVAHRFEQLEEAVAQADIVFSAVKTSDYIIFPHMLKPGAIVFDLCLPRTVHAGTALKLYTIEHLTNQLDAYQEERQRIAQQMTLEIAKELLAFDDWRQQLGIVPLIQEIREKGLRIQAAAMESLQRKLPDLTEREQKQISKHMKGIVNQLIKEPILQLKEMAVGDNSTYDIALICKIFGLMQEEIGGSDEDH